MTVTDSRWRRHKPFDVLASLMAAAATELGLRFLTLPDLAAALSVPLTAQAPPTPRALNTRAVDCVRPDLTADEARRLATVVAVMRRWPWGASCLRVALVSGRLLRDRRPLLALGVRRDGPDVTAHAWLLVDGRALDPAASDYAPLAQGMKQ